MLSTDLSQISKFIYLGDRNCAKNKPLLQSLGVKRVLVAGSELTKHFPDSFTYLHIAVKDSYKENIALYFEEVC